MRRLFLTGLLTAALPAAFLLLVSYAALTLLRGELVSQRNALSEARKRLAVLEARSQDVELQTAIYTSAAELITKLDAFLDAEVEMVSSVAKLPSVLDLNPAQISGTLDAQLETRGELESLFALDVRLRGVAIVPANPSFLGAEHSHNVDARGALTSFRPVVADVSSGRVTVFAPVVSSEGKPRGVVGGVVRGSALGSQFSDFARRGFSAFVTSLRTGSVLATFPDTARVDLPAYAPVLAKIKAREAGGLKLRIAGNPYVGYGRLSNAEWGVALSLGEEAMVRAHRKGSEAEGASGSRAGPLARVWTTGPYDLLRNPFLVALLVLGGTALWGLLWAYALSGGRAHASPPGARAAAGGASTHRATRTVTEKREEVIRGVESGVSRPPAATSVEIEPPVRRAVDGRAPAVPARSGGEAEGRLHGELSGMRAEVERLGRAHDAAQFEKERMSRELSDLDSQLKQARSPDAQRKMNEYREFVEVQGKEAIAPTDSVSLTELVKQIVLQEQKSAEARRLQWDISLEAKIPEVRTHRARLSEVLQFFVSRIVAGSGSFARVSASVSPRDAAAELVLQSSGIQVPVGEYANLFAQYHDESATLGAVAQGAGLQFAIRRRLLELLGAEIELSPDPARGTRFVIRLPYHPLERAAPQAPATSGPFTAPGFSATQVVMNPPGPLRAPASGSAPQSVLTVHSDAPRPRPVVQTAPPMPAPPPQRIGPPPAPGSAAAESSREEKIALDELVVPPPPPEKGEFDLIRPAEDDR